MYRKTWVEIDKKAIFTNIKNVKKHLKPGTEIMAVIKANGYGHGAVEVAKTATEAGATFLSVAMLEEALALRNEGIKTPILILGYTEPEYVKIASENNISLTVFQREWLVEAKRFMGENGVKLHIKIDTGMGRIGLREKEDFLPFIEEIKKDSRFKVEGIFTHFATADEVGNEYTTKQYGSFVNTVTYFGSQGIHPPYIHFANSAFSIQYPNPVFNMARVGIIMYGLAPSEEMKPLIPFELQEAFTLHSQVIHVKKVKKGDAIGYGNAYVAEGEEWIGTVPIGYADGLSRGYAKEGEVLVNGIRCPILNRICMDQLMIKLPYGVQIGTQVTFIGTQKEEKISVDEIAQKIGTINYEVVCMISDRVPRIYE